MQPLDDGFLKALLAKSCFMACIYCSSFKTGIQLFFSKIVQLLVNYISQNANAYKLALEKIK